MLLSIRLITLIEQKSALLGKRWTKAILKNKMTPSFARLSEKELTKRAVNVFSSIGHWLDKSISNKEARRKYFKLGCKRYNEGFGILELTVALSLEKGILWDLIEEECSFDSSYDIQAALELFVEITVFFDRAQIYTIQGYEHERQRGIKVKGIIKPTKMWFTVPDKKPDKTQ